MMNTLTKRYGYLLLSFLFSTTLLAQTPAVLSEEDPNIHARCATPPLTEEQVRYTLEVIAKQAISRNAGTTCVPIQAHILRRDDGTGGISSKDLNAGLANLNYMFKPANIEFYWSPEPKYINNTDYYIYSEQVSDDNGADTEAGLKSLLTIAPNAVNLCFLSQIVFASGNNTTGLASGPSNNASSNFIWLHKNYFTNAVNSIGVHEFGHYFSLPHTHNGTEGGNAHWNAENVPRIGPNANCSTKGDLICDTEADPKGTTANCTYNGGAADINGVPYTPPIDNIMSYYPGNCGTLSFTPNQYTRIEQALATRLTHTAYTLTSAPAVVNNPSGLVVVQHVITSAAILTWADNAANETGYLIERSTVSNSTGFVPVAFGGVDKDITTFIDPAVSAGTTYFYRVKASNDNCNDYSNVVSFTGTPSYCHPTYITNCKTNENGDLPRLISSVKLKTLAGATIFEKLNSSCSNELSNFTAISGNVVAGGTYNISIGMNSVNGCLATHAGVWLDINDDKDFNDAGEYLGSGTINGCGLTIPITISLATINGNRRLRVRNIGYFDTMASTAACGNFSEGETEDYTLNVSGGIALAIELLEFKASKYTDKSTLIRWKTASEKDVDKLFLQVSNDAVNYTTINEISRKGSQIQGDSYQFEHLNPFRGANYYRLMELSLDGKTQQVAQGMVEFKEKSAFTVQPNPTQGAFTLSFYADYSENANLVIYDVFGRVVLTNQYQTQEGNNNFDISLPNTLPNGVYFVRLEEGGVFRTAKIKKQD